MKASFLLLSAVLLSPVACRRPDGRTAYVELTASDIREGAPVRFQGFEIGKVQKVALRRSGMIATLLIQRADAPIQSNDRVAVHEVGIFGDKAIDIIPSPSDAPSLRDGDTLHAAPKDSLTPAREALTRAIVREFTERLMRSGSVRPDSTDFRNPHP